MPALGVTRRDVPDPAGIAARRRPAPAWVGLAARAARRSGGSP